VKNKEKQMNAAQKPAGAIPVFASEGDKEASLEEVEKASGLNLKEACNEFLFKWVPPGMTIAEFEQVSCGLLVRIQEEWDKRGKS